ncbi:helix-turn-helix transcriptional regulator [Terribacillus sp. 7520-G]|uniref:helix-turn-helix transcriptional regulator n=1 Tax=Terribacillus TaxID=459532 RepID=UPI000BA521D7|nr:helix-turn-helix transcriptional regulator [Terribacillus sp. 7520-G]PAD37775.1 transcriptional regulator [Terribacillus sp. 7520-G]
MKVNNRVKELRQERSITQVKMAEDLAITRQTINAIEKGKYNPSLELALRMLAYFDVPMEQLFYLEEE